MELYKKLLKRIENDFGYDNENLAKELAKIAEKHHNKKSLNIKPNVSVEDNIGRNCPFCGKPCVECSHKETKN
jgi:hypothetical protein